MAEKKEEGTGTKVALTVGSFSLGVALAALFAGKPAAGAEEQIKYLTELLEQIAQGNVVIVGLLEDIKGSLPISVSTEWVAKDPESIFDRAIRAAETVDADKMVDYTRSKRLVFKVESSLDQAVQIQLVGDVVDNYALATNIGPILPCAANASISVGLAWDDWHPFIGVRVTTAVAPTTGMLKIWAVLQD